MIQSSSRAIHKTIANTHLLLDCKFTSREADKTE